MIDIPSSLDKLHAWPEALWPFGEEILENLPAELRPSSEELREICEPWQLKDVVLNKMLQNVTENRIAPSAEVSEKANIEGPVFVEEGVKIKPFASIYGPAYLAKDSFIGEGVLLMGSFVGAGTVVSFGSEVKRSVVGRKCYFHTSKLLDSLVGDNVDISTSGTANEKLIDNTRFHIGAFIGSNTKFAGMVSVMPGIKVGRSCLVMPGVILDRDLPDGKIIRVKQETRIIDSRRIFKHDE